MTSSPISAVSPMTTPMPWSMKKRRPMVAPGWISMPVRNRAASRSSFSLAKKLTKTFLGNRGSADLAADVVVQHGGDVTLTKVANHSNNEFTGVLRALGELQGRPDDGAGGDAAQDAFLDAELARDADGVF